MKKIIFATGNKNKLAEASRILGINVEGVDIDIDEVQSLDRREVAVKKAQEYYRQVKKPLFVEDNSLEFLALNGLPGVYIDSFFRALGNRGLIRLLRELKDRGAVAYTTLVYIWGKDKYKIFESKVEGSVTKSEKGEGFGWDPIFIPRGENKTFGQMPTEEKDKYSMRASALKKLQKWLHAEKLI